MSHDLLDDLLVDVPRHVAPDARAAWRAGAGRRRRRYAVEGLAVGATVVLVGLALAQLHDRTPVEPANPAKVVSGYPRDVPRPFFEADLPSKAGPMAGVLQEDEGRWHAVDEHGRTWRLPETASFVSLSDDGTRLGYLRAESPGRGTYETLDLVSGEVQSYPEVGEGTTTSTGDPVTDQPYWAGDQQPAYWSPDDERLLLVGGATTRGVNALVLEHGEVTPLTLRGFPVGWTSPTTLVTLADGGRSAREVDVTGAEVRRVELDPSPRGPGPEPIYRVDQWSGRVSPDGSTLAVVVVRFSNERARLWTYSLGTGRAVDPKPPLTDPLGTSSCPPVWTPDGVAVWHSSALTRLGSGGIVIEPSERWHYPGCAAWASRALAGDVQSGPGITQWRYWPFWWWWKELLGGLAAALVIGGIWTLDRRDRIKLRARRATPGAPSPPSGG